MSPVSYVTLHDVRQGPLEAEERAPIRLSSLRSKANPQS
jgi:hypothetical protein